MVKKFDIANELDFNGVDFKNIGIIRAGLDKNVKINIKFLSSKRCCKFWRWDRM